MPHIDDPLGREPGWCNSLRGRDKIAAGLCRAILESPEASIKDIDGSEMRPDYSKPGLMPVPVDSNDVPDAVEIYQAYLRMCGPTKSASKAAGLFHEKFRNDPPWVVDPEHAAAIEQIIGSISVESGAAEDPVLARAQLMMDYVRLPKSKGGLGIKYQNDHREPEADINGVIDRGFARCSELAYCYYSLAKALGFEANPIEVVLKRDGNRESYHSILMLTDKETGRSFFIDPLMKVVDKTTPYPQYYIGTEADLFATYLYNTSIEYKDGHRMMRTGRGAPIAAAESIAPSNFLVQYGMAMYEQSEGHAKAALRHYRNAAELRPDCGNVWAKICLMTFEKDACERNSDSK